MGIISAMKRFSALITALLLILTFNLLPFDQVGARLEHFSPDLSAQGLITEVNALRVSNNLPPYQINPVLMRIAQTHADYIASTGVMTQFSADGRRPFQRAMAAGYSVAGDISAGGLFGELIHSGANLTPVEAVAFWRNDSVQRGIMLSPEFMDAGAGMAVANGVTYYVLDVGAEGTTLTPTATSLQPGAFVVSTAGARGTEAVIIMVSTPLDNGEVFHVVERGEALWSIALAYGTTIENLVRLNSLASDAIFEGQTLLVQNASTETPTPTETPAGTATFGIPTSTATSPVAPTITSTSTPAPVAPASFESGGIAVVIIILAASIAAGFGAFLGRKKARTQLD
jgi:hypothetical protein